GAALHLGPKAGAPGARVHGGGVGAVHAQPIPDAVVRREVARRLGRRDQVVGRHPVRGARYRYALDGGALLFERERGLLDRRRHVGLHAFGVRKLLDDADAQPVDAGVEGLAQARRGLRDRGGVERIVPRDHLAQQGGGRAARPPAGGGGGAARGRGGRGCGGAGAPTGGGRRGERPRRGGWGPPPPPTGGGGGRAPRGGGRPPPAAKPGGGAAAAPPL